MRRKKNWLSFRIRNKIILGIYLVLFPVLIIAGSFTYYQNYQTVMEENNRRYQAAVQTLETNIRYLEQDLEDISTYFCVDDAILRVLEREQAGGDRLFWTSQAPMDFIRSILAIKSQIRTLVLYPENGLPPFYVSRDTSVPVLDVKAVQELDIYRKAVAALGGNIWDKADTGAGGLFQQNKSDKLLLCREIFDLSKQRKLGFLILSIDMEWYERICRNALLNLNEAIVVLGEGDSQAIQVGEAAPEVVEYLRKNHPLPSLSKDIPRRFGGYYIFGVSDFTGRAVYYLSPVQNWEELIRNGLWVPMILAAVLLVCIWPFSVLASQIISRPLNRLYYSMNRFKEGDFEQQVMVKGNDEIAELSDTFNVMVRDIKGLIDRNYVMVLRERESELNTLQAQINPHFLYNALDSLYWQAVELSQDKLAEDVLSLSELFRLLLSSGQSEILVSQELSIIAHYLHIQKMRFGKKLDYAIDVEEDVKGCSILKLVLQPFVENAIVHGLERKDSWGLVTVTGRLREDMLCFTIQDNGTGMSRERVESLLRSDGDVRYANQRIGHFAIRNVRERLALRHGGNFTLHIESAEGKGTTVNIKVPKEMSSHGNEMRCP